MSSFCLKPPYHIHNIPGFISAATGMDVDEAALKNMVRRNRNLHQVLNIRKRMSRADETPPADCTGVKDFPLGVRLKKMP